MLERIEVGDATPMDLEIMAQVQSNIIGNCLCVLGDAMAMPIGSMIEKFRSEFEEYMEEARRRNHIELNGIDPSALASSPHSGPMAVHEENVAVRDALVTVSPDTESVL
jgi:NADH-quinone oxidoreductase subunit F